jgi:microcystin-dependent protein
MGEIKLISWNFAPKGWSFCNGQLLPINQNQALFSLLGTMYGGNGQTTFGLPDFRGRVPVHVSGGIVQGQVGGEPSHTLNLAELPSHIHSVAVDSATAATSNSNTATTNSILGQSIITPPSGPTLPMAMYGTGGPAAGLAAQTLGTAGGSQPHENMQPYLVLNFIIALQGVFPSRN